MFKHKLILLVLLGAANINFIFGKDVSPETAKRVAKNCFFEKSSLQSQLEYNQVVVSSLKSLRINNIITCYIANMGTKGFVIVSAEDAVNPILAYSLEGNCSEGKQPENFSAWMDGIGKQIVFAHEHAQVPDEHTTAMWHHFLTTNPDELLPDRNERSVSPMLTSTWDQGYPYNMQCPEDVQGSGGHVVVGCVAIAMAQILYYWRYPLQGSGSHGYYSNYGYLFADFGNTTYNWNEMTNAAYTFSDEIAKLLSQVGISVNMEYTANSSGAYSENAVNALKNYFNYSSNATLLSKNDYSETDWSDILISNLDAGQPLYYDGFGTGGHAFNVDGYQGTDYFHFNWGWSGSYNGYFYLNNLNPGGYNFSEGQGAIVNLVPSGNYPYYCNGTTILNLQNGTIEDGSGPAANYIGGEECSWLIAPMDSVNNLTLNFSRFSTEENHDLLTIYDGTDTLAPILGIFSGNNLPPAIIASSAKMFITFRTDGTNTASGWQASYTSQTVDYCVNNAYFTAPYGTISDGSGPRDYHNNSVCRYKITPDSATSITLSFLSFNTFNENDYLSIYDLESQQLLYKFYGSANPGTVMCNTGRILLLFKTDASDSGQGWQFNYTASTLVGIDENNIKSGSLQVYPNPAKDLITINIAPGILGQFSLSLIAANGSEVYSDHFMAGLLNKDLQIDISNLSAGLYLLQLKSTDNIFMQKIMIR